VVALGVVISGAEHLTVVVRGPAAFAPRDDVVSGHLRELVVPIADWTYALLFLIDTSLGTAVVLVDRLTCPRDFYPFSC
jgi:hypothetical protein